MSSRAASAVPRPAPDRPVTRTNGRRVSRCSRWWSRSPGCRAWLKRADHALAICAKARRNFAEAEASNGASANNRQIDSQQDFAGRLGQPLDSLGMSEIDQQRDGGASHQLITADLHDAEPARFDEAGDAGRRGGDQLLALAAELGLVVGHQAPAGLDQAQREIGLAGARGTAQQHGAPCLAVAQRHAGRVDALAHLRPSAAGTRTVKRAPSTRPSGARRLEAEIEPP